MTAKELNITSLTSILVTLINIEITLRVDGIFLLPWIKELSLFYQV